MKTSISIFSHRWLLAGLLCLGLLTSAALTCSAKEETLDNAAIIELQGMSLGDAVILDKIKTTKCDFDTSIKGLKQLKAAKVSDAVIQAMIAAKNSDAPAAAPTPTAKTPKAASSGSGSNDPSAAHAAGAWVMQGKKLVRLSSEASAETAHGGGGAWAMGWGGSSKTQVILNGTKSELQLTERKPTFYLYLGRSSFMTGQDYGAAEFAGVESPREIVLAQFTLKTNKNHNERLLVTGSHNAYAGSTHGIEVKAQRMFESEKVADGIYKVTPKEDLADGEYAFCSATSRGHGRFFTFGLQGK